MKYIILSLVTLLGTPVAMADVDTAEVVNLLSGKIDGINDVQISSYSLGPKTLTTVDAFRVFRRYGTFEREASWQTAELDLSDKKNLYPNTLVLNVKNETCLKLWDPADSAYDKPWRALMNSGECMQVIFQNTQYLGANLLSEFSPYQFPYDPYRTMNEIWVYVPKSERSVMSETRLPDKLNHEDIACLNNEIKAIREFNKDGQLHAAMHSKTLSILEFKIIHGDAAEDKISTGEAKSHVLKGVQLGSLVIPIVLNGHGCKSHTFYELRAQIDAIAPGSFADTDALSDLKDTLNQR